LGDIGCNLRNQTPKAQASPQTIAQLAITRTTDTVSIIAAHRPFGLRVVSCGLSVFLFERATLDPQPFMLA
jgi:hypothetical protein